MVKMIERCGECGFYSWKKHRCTRGATQESDPKAPYYDDCPLPDAEPVRHGRWEEEDERSAYKDFLVSCSNCGALLEKNKALFFKYCYNCGWPMDGGVSDEG